MIERKIEQKLLAWKQQELKLPLVIKGARQVGKTTSVMEFAKKHYETVYELNFYKNPSIASIFDEDLDADTILTKISFKFPTHIFQKGKTLLFLDEIQACPKARTALKFLAKDPRFDVIATGSLLGINYEDVASFPVGFTEEIEMMGLDFEEFLWAKGVDKNAIELLKKAFKEKSPIDSFYHTFFLNLFKEYIVIGGMPAVVDTYCKTNDYARALRMQRGIIADYKNDVIKYAHSSDKQKILDCFSSITTQLAKDYKKFQYSIVKEKAGARQYGGALNWLKDAGIISFCYNLSRPEVPLEAFKIQGEFKVYMNDTGLLISMYEDNTADMIFSGNMGIFKGAIYENIIAECFRKSGKWLYYFAPSSQTEIDFVLNIDGEACLVEVKSADNTKSKSLKSILSNEKYSIKKAIRLSAKNVGDDPKIEALPLYMAFLL